MDKTAGVRARTATSDSPASPHGASADAAAAKPAQSPSFTPALVINPMFTKDASDSASPGARGAGPAGATSVHRNLLFEGPQASSRVLVGGSVAPQHANIYRYQHAQETTDNLALCLCRLRRLRPRMPSASLPTALTRPRCVAADRSLQLRRQAFRSSVLSAPSYFRPDPHVFRLPTQAKAGLQSKLDEAASLPTSPGAVSATGTGAGTSDGRSEPRAGLPPMPPLTGTPPRPATFSLAGTHGPMSPLAPSVAGSVPRWSFDGRQGTGETPGRPYAASVYSDLGSELSQVGSQRVPLLATVHT